MKQCQTILMSVLVIGLVGGCWTWARYGVEQARLERGRLAQENWLLLRKMQTCENLAAANRRLSNCLAGAPEKTGLPGKEFLELLRLRGEVTRLHGQPQDSLKQKRVLSDLFRDTSMREFQKWSFQERLESRYGKLLRKLKLTREKRVAFEDLLIQKENLRLDQAAASLDEESTATASQNAQFEAQGKAIEEELRQLLGEEDYKQFKAFARTESQRADLASFQKTLEPEHLSLSPEQEENLIQAQAETEKTFNKTAQWSDKRIIQELVAGEQGDEKLQAYEEEQSRLIEASVERARSILTEPQLKAYEKYLKDSLAQGRSAVLLSARIFSAKAAAP